MKVLHLSSSLSRRGGGIFEIELALAHGLQRLGANGVALGLADPDWPRDAIRWHPVPASVCSVVGPRMFGYSPGLVSEMLSANSDLVHLHYMWMYPSVAVRRWAAITRKPYVVTPNGMLEPWALKNSAWKKKIAEMFYENRMLRGAACIHANTRKEAEDVRAFGLRNPIAVIPNGIALNGASACPSRQQLESRFPALNNRRWILFLSRIHPKKGLPHLITAWKRIFDSEPSARNWLLVIAGPEELGHERDVMRLCNQLDLPWSNANPNQTENHVRPTRVNAKEVHPSGIAPAVAFTGPLHGQEKCAALGNSEIFVLPSFSEGFSMAVLEAAAAGLPVLLTPQCNFPELTKAGAAVEAAPNVEGCASGLKSLLTMTDSERREMGRRGRQLIEDRYTWPAVAKQMIAVYEWVLGKGPKPECVQVKS